jgi:hypothetical protein
MSDRDHEHEKKEDNFVEVSISTTSGFFPASGMDRVAIHQKVRVELKKAADKLELTNTDGWVATVGNPPREINVEQSFDANHLTGKVEIVWGPRHGGGGACTN